MVRLANIIWIYVFRTTNRFIGKVGGILSFAGSGLGGCPAAGACPQRMVHPGVHRRGGAADRYPIPSAGQTGSLGTGLCSPALPAGAPDGGGGHGREYPPGRFPRSAIRIPIRAPATD